MFNLRFFSTQLSDGCLKNNYLLKTSPIILWDFIYKRILAGVKIAVTIHSPLTHQRLFNRFFAKIKKSLCAFMKASS